jgi:hypothetical protein
MAQRTLYDTEIPSVTRAGAMSMDDRHTDHQPSPRQLTGATRRMVIAAAAGFLFAAGRAGSSPGSDTLAASVRRRNRRRNRNTNRSKEKSTSIPGAPGQPGEDGQP